MAEQQRRTGMGRVLVSLMAVLAVAIGLWMGLRFYGGGFGQEPVAINLKTATLLARPKTLDDFVLTGHDGQPIERKALVGNWTFMAFGYTHCPDVCPTMMATYDALEKELAKKRVDRKPVFLFVSVDPERDTPQRVGEYVKFFNPHIRGATASHQVLRPLTAQLGVLYQRLDDQETAMSYLIDHSASMLLLDPQARLAAVFSAPHDPREVAEDYLRIRSQMNATP